MGSWPGPRQKGRAIEFILFVVVFIPDHTQLYRFHSMSFAVFFSNVRGSVYFRRIKSPTSFHRRPCERGMGFLPRRDADRPLELSYRGLERSGSRILPPAALRRFLPRCRPDHFLPNECSCSKKFLDNFVKCVTLSTDFSIGTVFPGCGAEGTRRASPAAFLDEQRAGPAVPKERGAPLGRAELLFFSPPRAHFFAHIHIA